MQTPKVRLRRASLEDEGFLLHIRNANRHNFFYSRVVGSKKHHRWLVCELDRKDSDLLVIESEYVSIGTISLCRLGRGVCELGRFVIKDLYRGKGYGCAVIKEFKKCCRDYGARAIVLKTKPTNVDALILYLKHGFKITHYTNGRLGMKCKL